MPYGVDMPVPDVKNWRSRLHELQGYKVWSTSFLAWLHLMSDRYQAEVREALVLNVDLVFSQLDREQQICFASKTNWNPVQIGVAGQPLASELGWFDQCSWLPQLQCGTLADLQCCNLAR